ncbi:CHAT domain-containing protein, partial [Mycena pura]
METLPATISWWCSKAGAQQIKKLAEIYSQDQDLPKYLGALGKVFILEFKSSRDVKHLEIARQNLGKAVELTPQDHPDRADHLHSLAMVSATRYKRLGSIGDLEATLQYRREAVKLTPQDHPAKAKYLQNLAASLTDRHQKLGDQKDLHTAVQYDLEAVQLTSNDDPARAERVQNLATSFKDRYERLGDLKDLDAALQYYQEAAELTPKDDPVRVQRLQNLGISLTDRYRRLGDSKDLEAALQCDQEALELTPKNDPARADCLHNLGASFTDQYLMFRNSRDLEAALQYHQEAVELTPINHPARADRLQSLAISLSNRYQRFGDMRDLEATLQYKLQVLEAVPEGRPRADCLYSLAVSLNDRYQRLGDLKDLEAALQYNREAVELTPSNDPARAQCLHNLGASLIVQYRRLHNPKDLEAALQYHQEALELTPSNHPARADRMQGLAVALTEKYWKLHALKDLEAALKYKLQALELVPGDSLTRSSHLQSLAVSLVDRYLELGDLKDLEAALHYHQEAADLTPKNDPNRAFHLQNLALAYSERYKRLHNQQDLENTHTNYSASFDIAALNLEVSWKAAKTWVSFTTDYDSDPAYCIAAISAAFKLLPELLWIGNSISARHDAIHRLDVGKVTSDAVRSWIRAENLTAAVEFAEQGLATVIQQTLQLKTDIDGLPPDQAESLKHLSIQLYTGTSTDPMKTVNDRNEILKDIRKQPGFEYFLLPKPYKELRRAAKQGPVVILNSHQDFCDGIILLNPTSEPVHLELKVTCNQLLFQQTVLKELIIRCNARTRDQATDGRLFDLLTWLWTSIVEPIYQVLQSNGIHNGRLWWLPIGAFTSLPLHACPPADATDQFIHSYTTTLGSLIEAQTKKPVVTKVGIVGVTHTNMLGANHLVGVAQEVENILLIIPKPCVDCIKGEQATVDAVKAQLENCSWLHLACHGKQDLSEPTKSHLLLYNGNLELDTILKMPLLNSEVVFLAACQTAMGDSQIVNESFHLSGGFIAAGFRGAIGTLWSMNDEDGPLVAKVFYSHLFQGGQLPEASGAAEALHLAVKELRKQNVPYERWIPFIHTG